VSGRSSSGPFAVHYYDAVGAFLYEVWKQPSRAEVNEGRPVVTVSLKVLADGNVTQKRVLQPSGVMAMDNSVARVLEELRQLPPFREYGLQAPELDLEVRFELD
jgi:TonB family protein